MVYQLWYFIAQPMSTSTLVHTGQGPLLGFQRSGRQKRNIASNADSYIRTVL